MIYAALTALLLVQASGEPVFHASSNLRQGGLTGQDRPIMHHGRDLLVEQMNCGGLGNEVCEGDTCNDDLVPVNMGGLSTICRKPEEAPGGGPDNGTSGASPEERMPDPENCGGLGNEVCEGDTCDDDLVPVNMGGLKTICRKPEEAQGQAADTPAEEDAQSNPPEQPPATEATREDTGSQQQQQLAQPPQPEQPSGDCGDGGQPVCAGDDLDDREFECDYGFVGENGVCVPYEEEITSTPTAPEQPAQPEQPEQPAQPPQPEQPAQPPQPEQPAQPPQPEQPAQAPQPEQPVPPPPTGDFEFMGELTYYGGAGAGGACTQTYVPPGFTTFALNSPQFTAQNECGTCVRACWTNGELGEGERCVDAIIDNLCPECAFGDLDLGEGGSGRWPVKWNKIPCPSSGGLQFSKQGSNASYAKVKAEGGPASVTGMTCNGMQGSGTPDGYFEFNDTGNQNLDQGMDCTVTFSDGSSDSATGV